MPDWESDLGRGGKGERVLMKAFNMTKSNDLRWDLNTRFNKKLELKTDFLAHKTGNFAIEQFSDKDKKSIGGIDRAVRDKVDIFAFLVWEERKAYFWKVKELKEAVDKAKVEFISETRNEKDGRVWVTTNYIIKRQELQGSCFKVQIIEPKYFK
tara:strand:+ start:1916 stop:2377 length:462 start_codon:yes stop_codon:yes gene_type:complete